MLASEQEIIHLLEGKITEHEQKIQSLREATKALQVAEPNVAGPISRGRKRGRKPGRKNVSKAIKKAAPAKRVRKPRKGDTFENIILKLFEDGTPKTSRFLLDLFNMTTGRKLEAAGFSARLSMLKKNGSIASMKNPADGLSYFGKTDWFENGTLKPEYRSKIKS